MKGPSKQSFTCSSRVRAKASMAVTSRVMSPVALPTTWLAAARRASENSHSSARSNSRTCCSTVRRKAKATSVVSRGLPKALNFRTKSSRCRLHVGHLVLQGIEDEEPRVLLALEDLLVHGIVVRAHQAHAHVEPVVLVAAGSLQGAVVGLEVAGGRAGQHPVGPEDLARAVRRQPRPQGLQGHLGEVLIGDRDPEHGKAGPNVAQGRVDVISVGIGVDRVLPLVGLVREHAVELVVGHVLDGDPQPFHLVGDQSALADGDDLLGLLPRQEGDHPVVALGVDRLAQKAAVDGEQGHDARARPKAARPEPMASAPRPSVLIAFAHAVHSLSVRANGIRPHWLCWL